MKSFSPGLIGRLAFALAWHALIVLAIVTVPSFVFALPLWLIPLRDLFPSAVLVMVYGVLTLIVIGREWLERPLPVVQIGIWFLAALAPTFLVFLFYLPDVASLSEPVITSTIALMAVGIGLYPFVRDRARLALPVLGTAVLAVVVFNLTTVRDQRLDPVVYQLPINTSLYTVEAQTYRNVVPIPFSRGGGLAPLSGDVLLVTGDGLMYLVAPGDDNVLDVRQLPHQVPSNAAEFIADAQEATDTQRFRVTDILVDERDGAVRMLAAHHFWSVSEQCIRLRISLYDGDRDAIVTSSDAIDWTTLFETEPCLPIKKIGAPFSGHVSGGRLALLDVDTLLFSTGDLGWDGYNSSPAFSQEEGSDYGKIISIDLASGEKTIISSGLRNAQGLTVDSDKRIWATDHGMEGGDELNLILPGANYGWPYATFSTDYGTHVWPPNKSQGRHDGYEQPMFAWLPSIGISGLIEVRGGLFDAWTGDLLVGSFSGNSLFRVRTDDERVVAIERIQMPETDWRIRDLIETRDGRLLLWLDGGSLALIYPSTTPLTGSGLFVARCGNCHVIDDGTAHRIGPDLRNVVSRDIASAPGFRYSSSLQQLDGKWTKSTLDEYLRSPAAFATGTSMEFAGIAEEEIRRAIIDYMIDPD
jgi:cytochrome c2